MSENLQSGQLTTTQFTTTSKTSNPPSPDSPPRLKPWNLRVPCERDLEIYKHVKVHCAQQWIVAIKFGLHETRISQIVKKIHRWIAAGGNPDDPQLRDHVARERVSRAMQRMRLVRAVEVATHAVNVESRPLKVTRRRYVGGTEVWSEETSTPQPDVSLPAVRLLLKATQALEEFDRQEQPEEPPPQTEQDLLPAIYNLLCTWRLQAEADGRLQSNQSAANLVASALNQLLGTNLTHDQSSPEFILSAAPTPPLAPTNDRPTSYDNPNTPPPKKSTDL